MSVIEIAELQYVLAPRARLLGFDLGEKAIGVALSDTTRTIATPMQTLPRGKFSVDAVKIEAIVREQDVGGLVIGLPRNMDGSEGPSAQSARAFGRNLARRLTIPVVFWDERLSTLAVTRTLLDADASRRRRSALVDKMAAAFILQVLLDRLRNPT